VASRSAAGHATGDIRLGATAFLGVQIGSSSSSSGNGSGSGFDPFGGSTGSGSTGSQGTTSGVAISGVLSGSPAANAGLGGGDTITSVGGQSVSSSQDIAKVLVKYHPGQSIPVSWVDSSGQSHTANVTLASGPAA
jgi:S1-C subfamily serine protease